MVVVMAGAARAGRSQLFGPSVSLAACCWCWCRCWRLLALRALAVRNFLDRVCLWLLAAGAGAGAGVGACLLCVRWLFATLRTERSPCGLLLVLGLVLVLVLARRLAH